MTRPRHHPIMQPEEISLELYLDTPVGNIQERPHHRARAVEKKCISDSGLNEVADLGKLSPSGHRI